MKRKDMNYLKGMEASLNILSRMGVEVVRETQKGNAEGLAARSRLGSPHTSYCL